MLFLISFISLFLIYLFTSDSLCLSGSLCPSSLFFSGSLCPLTFLILKFSPLFFVFVLIQRMIKKDIAPIRAKIDRLPKDHVKLLFISMPSSMPPTLSWFVASFSTIFLISSSNLL